MSQRPKLAKLLRKLVRHNDVDPSLGICFIPFAFARSTFGRLARILSTTQPCRTSNNQYFDWQNTHQMWIKPTDLLLAWLNVNFIQSSEPLNLRFWLSFALLASTAGSRNGYAGRCVCADRASHVWSYSLHPSRLDCWRRWCWSGIPPRIPMLLLGTNLKKELFKLLLSIYPRTATRVHPTIQAMCDVSQQAMLSAISLSAVATNGFMPG
jgi:hypothetical protein